MAFQQKKGELVFYNSSNDQTIKGNFTGCGEALRLVDQYDKEITRIPTEGDSHHRVSPETMEVLNATMSSINK